MNIALVLLTFKCMLLFRPHSTYSFNPSWSFTFIVSQHLSDLYKTHSSENIIINMSKYIIDIENNERWT